jgi:DNA-binding transcriptional regulator YdaS (Cro superfamily)
MEQSHGLHRAIKAAGGLTQLARAIGSTKQGIWMWANRRQVPIKACPKIEAATGVPCEELRPDINWGYMRQRLQGGSQ